MDSKEIAKQLIASSADIKADVDNLKINIETLLLKYLKRVKDITGAIPSEEDFIKIVASILDEAIKLPQPYESVDGFIIEFALKMVDKYFLDKYLGKDWFAKLKNIIIGIN